MRRSKRLLTAFLLAVLPVGAAAAQAPRAAPKQPTPAPKPAAAKPAPPGRQTLAAQAGPICDNAQSLPAASDIAVGPALTLIKADGAEWAYQEPLQVPKGALPADAVKVVVCINEVLTPGTQKYTDGTGSLMLAWELRVVSWPEGKLLRMRRFSVSPPYTKKGPGPGVGERPVELLAGLLDHSAIVGHLQAPAGDISTQVALSPDHRLFAASTGKVLTVWDVASGQNKSRIEASAGEYYAIDELAFSPDAKSLVSAVSEKKKKFDSTTKYLTRWDLATGKEAQPLQGNAMSNVRRVAYSPDGRLIVASAGGSPDVKLWDAATGKELRTLSGHSANVWGFAFAADGKTLATAGTDKTVRLWDLETGSPKQTLDAEKESYAVALSGDGKLLASAHGGGYSTPRGLVILWDLTSAKRLREFQHDAAGGAVAFSPSGHLLATGALDGAVRLFDIATGKELVSLSGHGASVELLSFAADGARLFSASNDGSLKTWDLSSLGAPTR